MFNSRQNLNYFLN